MPSFDAVLIAMGGGALATGVGHVIKARAPDVEVICIQSARWSAGGNADWFTITADGLMLPDVRLAIQTHDEAIILVQYSGRCVSSAARSRWPSSPLCSRLKTPLLVDQQQPGGR